MPRTRVPACQSSLWNWRVPLLHDSLPFAREVDTPCEELQRCVCPAGGLHCVFRLSSSLDCAGRFLAYSKGHLVLTCGTDFRVSVENVVWDFAGRATAGTNCTPMDVTADLERFCAGKEGVCSAHLFTSLERQMVGAIGGILDDVLELPDPCPLGSEGLRKLTGTFRCKGKIAARSSSCGCACRPVLPLGSPVICFTVDVAPRLYAAEPAHNGFFCRDRDHRVGLAEIRPA